MEKAHINVEKAKQNKNKALILILFIVLISFVFCGCKLDSEDLSNQAKSIVQSENEFVLGVKGGSPSTYPDITYEEAFGSFFGYPTWTYFQGTIDGDDALYDIVEFTGNCMYNDIEVKALIQFTVNVDDETFDATYFSLNDIPQTTTDLYGLIDIVFSEYRDSHQ